MKYNIRTTSLMILIFFVAQFIGLLIIPYYIDVQTTAVTGTTTRVPGSYEETGVVPPEIENESLSFLYILSAVLIGTAIVLLIIKFKKTNIWKFWFFLSVTICLTLSLLPFVKKIIHETFPAYLGTGYYIAIALAAILAFFKVIKNNIMIHNITELFIYGGIAVVLVYILNIPSAIILLILISIYDIYAVRKSKHMVRMAKFQTESKVFAGLMIPYKHPDNNTEKNSSIPKENQKKIKKRTTKTKTAKKTITISNVKSAKSTVKDDGTRTAILGGGDITFPLLFAGVILKTTGSFFQGLVIIWAATVALSTLFWISKKDTFYPAMPYISAGCFLGYIITLFL